MQSKMCKEQHCHCYDPQETRRLKDQARSKVYGKELVAENPHNKHDRSDFTRDGLKVYNFSVSVCEEENVELITVELPGVVHSIYKQSPEAFRIPALGQNLIFASSNMLDM